MCIKKGAYFHSSFACMALFNLLGPIWGLPFVTGSLPHSPPFVHAMTQVDKNHKPIGVVENRVAPFIDFQTFFPSIISCCVTKIHNDTQCVISFVTPPSTQWTTPCLLCQVNPQGSWLSLYCSLGWWACSFGWNWTAIFAENVFLIVSGQAIDCRWLPSLSSFLFWVPRCILIGLVLCHWISISHKTESLFCKLVTTWKTRRPCALFFKALFADSVPILPISAPRLPETAVFGALIFVGLKAALGTQLWEPWQAQPWQLALVGQRYRNMSKDKRPDWTGSTYYLIRFNYSSICIDVGYWLV